MVLSPQSGRVFGEQLAKLLGLNPAEIESIELLAEARGALIAKVRLLVERNVSERIIQLAVEQKLQIVGEGAYEPERTG